MYVPSYSSEAERIILETPHAILQEIILGLTERVLDVAWVSRHVYENQRVLEMRKDDGHESWMEQR